MLRRKLVDKISVLRGGGFETAQWAYYSIFLGLFPVWAGYFVYGILRVRPKWETFTSQGEFAAYGTSLIMSVLYVLQKERTPSFPWRKLWTNVAQIIWILSVVVFGIVTVAKAKGLSLDTTVVTQATLALYGAAVVISLIVVSIDHAPTGQQVRERHDSELINLREQFEAQDA